MPGGVKFNKAGFSQKDMDFVNLDDRSRDKILAAFGVPKSIVGIPDGSNRASSEEINRAYIEHTVRPKMIQIVDYLNTFYLPMFNDEKLFFDFDDPTPENRELLTTERVASLGGSPWQSVNEVREEDGLPPVDGGDAVYGNPLFLPIGEPSEQKAIKRIKRTNGFAPNINFVKEKERRNKMKNELVGKAMTILKDSIADALRNNSEEREEIMHKQFVIRMDRVEKALKIKIQKHNAREKREVLKNLRKAKKGIQKKKDVNKKKLFNKKKQILAMIDLATPLLAAGYLSEGKEALGLLGLDVAFDVVSDKLVKSIALMSRRYTSTTLNLLTRELNAGLKEGESFPKLEKRVSKVYDFSDKVRAKRVARTETFRTGNFATRDAWRKSGVVSSVKWFTAADERVDKKICAPLHGRIVGINDNFFDKGDEWQGVKLDYANVENPPIHPLCRCYIRPESIRT